MVQIPLLSGVVGNERADFGLSYPVNLEPVPLKSGISNGYLRSAAGALQKVAGPGLDRGGIVWNGTHYRVMGGSLLRISTANIVTVIGDVGDDGLSVALDFGFDRLAIASAGKLFYFDGSNLSQVTDPDLGTCLDMLWMDGYYVSTDGTSIVVTNLANPFAVNPLKYGSAEADPDMVTGVHKLRSELYVLGQNTIQVFNIAGGSGFPFQANLGATIPIGCVGARAKARFSQTFAFVGSGRNQGLAVWAAQGGTAQKLSTRAIDDYLQQVLEPSLIEMECRFYRDEQRLMVHLPDLTLVYLQKASEEAGQPVWYECRSGLGMAKPYRLRHAVLFNDQWYVGDTESGAIGILDEATAEHFGEAVGWRFDTELVYNSAKSGIAHSLELVGLPGRGDVVSNHTAFMSYTTDGVTWSVERAIGIGRTFNRRKRIVWRPHKRFRNYMGLRFRGDSSALAGYAALEAELEGLAA